MGFVLLKTAFALRLPYDRLARQSGPCEQPRASPDAPAAKALRERDWLMLAYLCAKSVDPRSPRAKSIINSYEEDPDKFAAQGRILPGWVCRPMDELVGCVLGKDDVTTSTTNMAMDSLRRLERCHLLRIHGARRRGKMPLVELLPVERAEELGVSVPWPKSNRKDASSSADDSPTDLAGNMWNDSDSVLSTSWETEDE